MSDTTKDINRVTGAIIRVSLRLIIYALVVLLLYEGVTAGYSFGYAVFAGTAVSEDPGITASVAVEEGQDAGEGGQMLEEMGLIQSRYIFMIQALFYEYDIYPGTYQLNTSMTSKEMLEEMSVLPTAETEGVSQQ